MEVRGLSLAAHVPFRQPRRGRCWSPQLLLGSQTFQLVAHCDQMTDLGPSGPSLEHGILNAQVAPLNRVTLR